jgi:hypothetical protein
MKRGFLILVLSFSLIFFLVKPAEAGISLGEGGVTLSPGQTYEMCDVWIYATQEGGTYHVDTTGDLKPLTLEITPNDFSLDPIDCPQESKARRECIAETCMSEDQNSCEKVCITFAAPSIMNWNTENVVYTGGILNSIKIGAATINEPYEFSIYVTPMDMRPLVIGAVIVIVIIVILLIVFAKRLRKR